MLSDPVHLTDKGVIEVKNIILLIVVSFALLATVFNWYLTLVSLITVITSIVIYYVDIFKRDLSIRNNDSDNNNGLSKLFANYFIYIMIPYSIMYILAFANIFDEGKILVIISSVVSCLFLLIHNFLNRKELNQ